VDVVVVMFRDRLARGIHAGLLAEEFKEHGCQFVALNAHVDDSPEGELQGGLLDLFASYERSVFRRRAERGVAQKVKQGKLIRGPRAPYGFHYSEDGESLRVNEQHMAVVRRIFREVGAEGQTLGALVKALTREGVPSPTGGNWHRPTLRYLILSELYWPRSLEELEGLVSSGVLSTLDPERSYGLWCYNKRRQLKWRERTEDGGFRNRYKIVVRPRSEWGAVPVDLSDAGLIRELVEASRERISDRQRRPPSTIGLRFWELSGGIARCGECGSVLSPTGHPRKSGNGHRFYYVCRQRYSNGPRTCPATRNYPAASLEEAVWNSVRAILHDPERAMRQYDEYVERLKAQLTRGDPDREASVIAGRLAKLERRRSGYLDLAADGDMSREDLRSKLAEVEIQRKELQDALRSAQEYKERILKLKRERKIVFRQFAAMRDIDLRCASSEDRRRLLEALRVLVELDKDGNARISGMFDTDIVELLPMVQHLRDEARHDKPYRRHFRYEVPPEHKGVITLDTTPIAGCSPSPTTS